VPERIIFKIAVQDGDGRSTYGSSHRSPTSRLDKDCGLPHLTIYSFMPSLSLALAHVTTYTVDVTSSPSLLTFRKRLKLHPFRLSYPGLVL